MFLDNYTQTAIDGELAKNSLNENEINNEHNTPEMQKNSLALSKEPAKVFEIGWLASLPKNSMTSSREAIKVSETGWTASLSKKPRHPSS